MVDFWKGKRVLVTGHTGFKGSWLSFWLSALGADVCGFALKPDTQPSLFENLRIGEQIRSVIGDIRDLNAFEKLVTEFRPDVIFHLAAQSLVRRSYREPVDTYSTNLLGTVHVLEAIRKVGDVGAAVIVTTDKVYENEERELGYVESDRLGGFDPYANSKACAEMAVAAYRSSFFGAGGTLVATARAGNVIGGGDWSEDRLLPDVFRSLIFGEPLTIRNPSSVRPWQHVLDPLSGYVMLAERLFNGDTKCADAWNFGPSDEDAREVSWILNEIKGIWDGGVTWTVANDDEPHESHLLKLDSSKARSELQWTPKLALSDAVRLTAEWYRGFKNGEDAADLTRQQIEVFEGIDAAKSN
ncbi:MAG: CDP-glucose 4,6-dehydratase [Pyrinomonadaceae bacterium]